MKLVFPLLLASVLLILAALNRSESLFLACNTWFAVSYLLCRFRYPSFDESVQCTPPSNDSKNTTGPQTTQAAASCQRGEDLVTSQPETTELSTLPGLYTGLRHKKST